MDSSTFTVTSPTTPVRNNMNNNNNTDMEYYENVRLPPCQKKLHRHAKDRAKYDTESTLGEWASPRVLEWE